MSHDDNGGWPVSFVEPFFEGDAIQCLAFFNPIALLRNHSSEEKSECEDGEDDVCSLWCMRVGIAAYFEETFLQTTELKYLARSESKRIKLDIERCAARILKDN
jgi:hypothetical protein